MQLLYHCSSNSSSTSASTTTTKESTHIVSTDFFEWSCRFFATPVMQIPEDGDPQSDSFYEQEFRCLRAARIKERAMAELTQAAKCKL